MKRVRRALTIQMALWFILAVAPAAHAVCAGDCNGNGEVTVDELVRGVNIALGGAELNTCTALDSDGDSSVAVNELVAAVSNALGGCSVSGTPTPSPTRTPTTTPTAPCGDSTSLRSFFESNRGFRQVYRTGGNDGLFSQFPDPAGYRLQTLALGGFYQFVVDPGVVNLIVAVEAEDVYEDLEDEVLILFRATPEEPHIGLLGVFQCDKRDGLWLLSVTAASDPNANVTLETR